MNTTLPVGLYAYRFESHSSPADAIISGAAHEIFDPVSNEKFESNSRLFDQIAFTREIEKILDNSQLIDFFYVCPDGSILSGADGHEDLNGDNLNIYGGLK